MGNESTNLDNVDILKALTVASNVLAVRRNSPDKKSLGQDPDFKGQLIEPIQLVRACGQEFEATQSFADLGNIVCDWAVTPGHQKMDQAEWQET